MSRRLVGVERGQSLVIVALAIVAMIAMLALVLDGGYVYAQKRLVQNAVDAAALGAAGEVAKANSTDASVRAVMEAYANRNSPPGGISVMGTYIAANDTELTQVGGGSIPTLAKGVRVVGETNFNTFFMGVLGINQGVASAFAVARSPDPIGPGDWAIWVGATVTCANGALGWNASASSIYGGLRSNSNVQIGGGGQGTNVYGNVETVRGVQGPNISYQGTVPYPVEGIIEQSPYRFRMQDYQPGGTAAAAAGSQYYYISGDLTRTTRDASNQPYFSNTTNVLRSGLYYVTGNVSFQGGVSGTVTLVARGNISIKGGDNQLRLFRPSGNPCALGGILLYTDKVSSNLCSNSDSVIDLTGRNNLWEGIIHAPQGRVSITGSQLGTSQLNGSVIAQTVDVSGSNLTIRSTEYCANTGLSGEYLMR